MDSNGGLLVVIGVITLVILFNVGIALSFLRTRGKGQIFLFRDSLQKLVNPWKEEDEALSELRKRVAHLESNEHDERQDHETG
ncbi:MAG TPA: hypothetical protein G4O11_04460 [Anaerolineae bacterium]|nr:hypothetical protein [Anaerolineae bacterium]